MERFTTSNDWPEVSVATVTKHTVQKNALLATEEDWSVEASMKTHVRFMYNITQTYGRLHASARREPPQAVGKAGY